MAPAPRQPGSGKSPGSSGGPRLAIEVLDDPARACAAMLLGPLLGDGHLVLTGGSTPAAAYGELAAAVLAGGRDVDASTVWFSDERCVGPDDELSNYGALKRSLLEPLEGSLAGPRIMRMEGELGPEQAAERYAQTMREVQPLPFDIVLLGMGPNSHIASLFPDQESLNERSRWVAGVPDAGLEPFVPRVTLTLPALSRARHVVFLVTGEGKADAVAAAFGQGVEPDPHVPASLLVPLAKEITVLLDPPAAARL